MTTTHDSWTDSWPVVREATHDELAERIEGHIERMACGRIRDLHVLRRGDTIILHGRSRTYHAKQLAQEAAIDLAGHAALANLIEVC